MNVRHLAALLVVLCATTARTASSQAPDSLHSGDRIRVHRFDARHPRVGTLVAHSPDSLTVEWQNGARETMAMFEIGQVDVSIGRRHYVERGTAYGLAIGAALGLMIRNVIDRDRQDPSMPKGVTGTNAMLVTLGGGAIFGAVTGALGTELWEPTTLGGSRTRVGLVVPVSRRVLGVRISTAF